MDLNKDVAILQKHLKGSMPSRESVTKLLYEVIIDDDEERKKKRTSSGTILNKLIVSQDDFP